MPEGPEIKLAADSIDRALSNRKVDDIFFAFDHLKKFENQIKGRKIRSVTTRGKAILITIDTGQVIYSHNQLYGRWYITGRGKVPSTNRQLRLAIHNRSASAFLYSASDIEVLSTSNLSRHRFLSKLGPDLLSENPSRDEIVERMQSSRFCKRQLGGLLLDQAFLAGLGNYLRAEILFFARLHPARTPADCNVEELNKLSNQMLQLIHRSYKTRGVVNPPALVKKLKGKGKTQKEQHRFSVYNREGLPCYNCSTLIARIPSGGRHIYFCPSCQEPPG